MSDKQTSSCVELSEIRKLDQLLTQCETSSCEHICRDCCARLGSLEDITDHQDEEEAYVGEELLVVVEGDCDVIPSDRAAAATIEDGPGCKSVLPGTVAAVASDCDVVKAAAAAECGDVPCDMLCESEPATESMVQCTEPLTCDGRLNHLTVCKPTLWICENCEGRNRRLEQRRRGGNYKKHSLTINEKPTKLVRLMHKCSSENCLKHNQQKSRDRDAVQPQRPPHRPHASSFLRQPQKPFTVEPGRLSPSNETISGGVGKVHKTKLSPQLARRISCRIPDDLEVAAREALLGSRFGSLHEKKLPEPVETVCAFQIPTFRLSIIIYGQQWDSGRDDGESWESPTYLLPLNQRSSPLKLLR